MATGIGMAPRLSIVVPAADVAALEDTLVSVLENRPADCEVIVSLAVPYDDPWHIGDEVRFLRAPTRSSLVDCVNLGLASSRGEIVHVLAAGWLATEGWADAALARFADPHVAAVVPATVAAADRELVVAAGIRRTRGGRSVVNTTGRGGRRAGEFRVADVPRPSAPGIEAGFWRAAALPRGGFTKACGDRLAAADMAAAIAAAKTEAAIEPGCRVVAGPAVDRESAFLAGLRAERLFWRCLAGDRGVTAMVAHAGEVLRHAAAVAPLGTLPMLAGRLLALVQFGSCLGRTRELMHLRRQAARREADLDAGLRTTVRIDAGHALPSRPRRAAGVAADRGRAAEEPPLRRSA